MRGLRPARIASQYTYEVFHSLTYPGPFLRHCQSRVYEYKFFRVTGPEILHGSWHHTDVELYAYTWRI